MERSDRRALEAILFVIDEPVDVATLSQVLEVGRVEVEAALRELAADYERDGRGFVLREVAGGWRLYTHPDAAPYLERFVLAGRSGRLSQAALETLAVIAYKQPIGRQEIGEIRGVSVDAPVRTLVSRGLVEEVGRDDGPGRAVLYGTTGRFLEQLGLRTLDDLPPLAEHLTDGPAPDEPHVIDLRRARERIASGASLPATGRPHWDPAADAAPDATRAAERELEDLSDRLETAARSAIERLDAALRAVEAPRTVGGDDGG